MGTVAGYFVISPIRERTNGSHVLMFPFATRKVAKDDLECMLN